MWYTSLGDWMSIKKPDIHALSSKDVYVRNYNYSPFIHQLMGEKVKGKRKEVVDSSRLGGDQSQQRLHLIKGGWDKKGLESDKAWSENGAETQEAHSLDGKRGRVTIGGTHKELSHTLSH